MDAQYVDYNLPEAESLVECPYNKAHQITRARLQTHLIKCRRSYPSHYKFSTCKYNSTHVWPEPEIALHELNCDSKIDVLRYMYVANEEKLPEPPKPEPVVHSDGAPAEENWDNDPEVKAYDPRKYCQKANVIRTIQHKTPSQRKAERDAERRRLNELNSHVN